MTRCFRPPWFGHHVYVIFIFLCGNVLPMEGRGYAYDYMTRNYVRDHDPDSWTSTNVLSIMQPQCVPIPHDITLCRDVGYTNMSLPNLLGHDTIQEVRSQANPWVPLFKVQCHPNTGLFLCSLYAPVCLDRPIYPCRSLCEAVKSKCEGYMKRYGFEWPDILKCDKFPNDDSLCIKQLNSSDETAANVCTPCKQPITFESLLDSYCWSNLVLKVKIRRIERSRDGHMRIITKGKKNVFKPKPNNFGKEELKKMELIIHNGAKCDCDTVNSSKKALVMGSLQGNVLNVTFVSGWSKSREFKKAVRAIRKKHDCKKEIESIANANNGGLSTEGKKVPGEDEALSKIESNEIGKPPGGRKRGKGKKKNKGKGKGKDRKKGRGKKKGKKKNNSGGNSEPEDPMANFAGIGCVPCKQPLVFEHLTKLFCEANFVITTRLRSVEIDQSNGDKQLITKKLRRTSFYRKENLSKREVRKLQPVISAGSTCDCLSASPGKGDLLIMGIKKGTRYEITFLSEKVQDIEFIRFEEAIKRGYQCKA